METNRNRSKRHHAAMAPPAIQLKYQEEEDYEVEDILNHDEPQPGVRFYHIKWKNYDDSWNSWEPENLLDNCPDKLREYKEKAGLPPDPPPPPSPPVPSSPTPPSLPPSAPTFKLTPTKAAPDSTTGGGKKKRGRPPGKGSSVTARKSVTKRKLNLDLPPPPTPPKQRCLASPPVAAGSSRKPMPMPVICDKPQILELIDDGTGKRMASIAMPDRPKPALMWYDEAKEKHPGLVIDFMEKHLTFKKTGGLDFVLLSPQSEAVQ